MLEMTKMATLVLALQVFDFQQRSPLVAKLQRINYAMQC